ncbi:MAG: hypothetical protein ABII64_05530 [Elusimicrobiota bacterium]
MIFNKNALVALAILFLVGGFVEASSPGTSAFSFLKINPAARSVGMGELTCVIAAQNSILNPAILPWIENSQLSFQHIKYLQDTSYSLIGYVHTFPNEAAMNVSVGMLGVKGLTKTEYSATSAEGYIENGEFVFGDKLINIGYGFRVSRDVSFGGSLKYVQETIETNSVGSALFSFGGFYFPWATDWQISFGCSNLGTKVKGFEPPTALFAGAGKQLYPYLFWGVEGISYFDQVTEIRTGVEYNYAHALFLRAGYKHLLEDQKLGELPWIDLTAGIGFIYENFSFDYAWAPYGDLGQAHRVTMGYTF